MLGFPFLLVLACVRHWFLRMRLDAHVGQRNVMVEWLGGHDFWFRVACPYQGLCWELPREDAGDSMIPMTSDPEVPSYYGTLFMRASGK